MRRALMGVGAVIVTAYPNPILAQEEQNYAREQLNAVVWVQNAPEYGATTRSVYSAARAQLPQLRRKKTSASIEQMTSGENLRHKPNAVVVDIDETILDNSAYNALLVRDRKRYDEPGYEWARWVEARQAPAVQGAIEFVTQARKLKYKVLFVTNRSCNRQGSYAASGESTDCPQEAPTHRNLSEVLGYEPSDDEVYLRYERRGRADGDKQDRRLEIAASYRIAMLVGDDINDFISAADYVPATHDEHWGIDWFAIPNPMYGTWDRKYAGLQERYASLRIWDKNGAGALDSARTAKAIRTLPSVPSKIPVQLGERTAAASGLSTFSRPNVQATRLQNGVTRNRGLAVTGTRSSRQPADTVFLNTSPPDNLRVHIVPVGAGSCHIIECPDSKDVIINDCGQRGGASPGSWSAEEIKQYLAAIVGTDRPSVVISHPHTDHYSFLPKILDPKTVDVALFGGSADDFQAGMSAWLSKVAAGRVRFGWEAGYHEEVPELACGAAKVHMVTVNVPSDDNEKQMNANSLVLAIEHNQVVALFPGDAEGSTQRSAVANYPELLNGVTLLAVQHHGAESHGSNSADWAQIASPQIAVYSAGVIDGHPRASVVTNYQHNLFDAATHPLWISPHRTDEQTYDSLKPNIRRRAMGSSSSKAMARMWDLPAQIMRKAASRSDPNRISRGAVACRR